MKVHEFCNDVAGRYDGFDTNLVVRKNNSLLCSRHVVMKSKYLLDLFSLKSL